MEGVDGGPVFDRRRRWLRKSSKATMPSKAIAANAAHTSTPPAKGNSQRSHCSLVAGGSFSAPDGWEERPLSVVTTGGGVTCMGVGEGGTSVSSGGCMAKPGTGCAAAPAKITRMDRPTTTPYRTDRRRPPVSRWECTECRASLSLSLRTPIICLRRCLNRNTLILPHFGGTGKCDFGILADICHPLGRVV